MNAPARMSATPLRQVQDVKGLLMNEQARQQLSMVAAKHMNPERMMRVVANAIRTTPKLGQCDPMSFLGALMQCASLGLEPNTVLGHAYMIPFENNKKGIVEVQVVVGYKGLIDLARRSGHITSLSANIHYSDDELWEYEEGTEARLRHRPAMQNGKKLHAYAIAQFKDGGHAYVVLPWAHIEKIRDSSQGYKTAKRFNKLADSPWVKHEDEMAKKTAIRALAKYLPLSVEFVEAIATDEARADYRAFAMDPTQGVQMDDDEGEPIEGESEAIEGEAAQIEDTSARDQKVEPAPAKKAEPAPRQNRRDATPYTEMSAKEAAPAKAETQAQEQAGPDYQGLINRISGDLLEGAAPEDLLDTFAAEIAAMKQDAPAIFKRLEHEIGSFAPDLIGKF